LIFFSLAAEAAEALPLATIMAVAALAVVAFHKAQLQ
jgi:hypothetical protein